MVRKVLTHLVDDLDGITPERVTTVQFSLDGHDYSIDPSAEHAAELRNALARYVHAARHRTRLTDPQRVRAWARTAGYYISPHGQVPLDIHRAYIENQPLPPPPPSHPLIEQFDIHLDDGYPPLFATG